MGITERRERERRELRSRIVEATRSIAAESGWDHVTVRRVAEEVEYSPQVIYRLFDGKDDLVYEVVRQGFGWMRDDLRDARQAGGDPVDGLLRVARAYWRMAHRCPETYQAMHSLAGVPFGTAETPVEAREAFAELRAALVDALGAEPADPDAATDIFWATLHGLVSLTLGGRIKGGPERAEELLEPAVLHQLPVRPAP